MIISVSKELCLGSLRNASVVYIMVNWGLILTGTCKVRNEIETKRNETKPNETERNETKSNERKRNEMKFFQNEM
jgi:hypothetical protein